MSLSIETVDVSVRHGVLSRLESISVALAPQRVHAIIGANGSGKSTLLTVLAGELKPTRGSVHITTADGHQTWRDLTAAQAARLRALLSQDTPMSFAYSVAEVIAWGRLPWRGTEQSAEDDAVIAEEIEANDIGHLLDRRITELSGGERARVHLARVLAQRAPLLLLDEADATLDLAGQAYLDAAIGRRRAAGDTVVVVSHDLSRVAALADDVTVMLGGRILAHGPTDSTMTAGVLTRAYGVPVEVVPTDGAPLIRKLA